jgi:ATP-dependent DNA helicase RecQ
MSGAVMTDPVGFRPQCLSLDLEVGKADNRIHQFGAVRGDNGETLAFSKGDLDAALNQLDALADDAAFLLGHNLVAFDLPHLKATRADLRLHQKPAVDTLRLNPLAFPRNPYHHLVKHYQDGKLHSGQRNDPLKDAQLALELFRDQHGALKALNESNPSLLAAWHWLTIQDEIISGSGSFFMTLRRQPRPSLGEAQTAIARCLENQTCLTQSRQIIDESSGNGWPLAYALAWLSVAGGNSVMPPWVRHQYPQAGEIVRLLRDTACPDPACSWCREHHDAKKELKRWFDFDAFRPDPVDPHTGKPLQQVIVEAAMGGQHVLGILPTGTGKSLCYQIPALSRFEKTGALTVVISPLVALMADQVAGLVARGINSCAALNGLLSMPERGDVLDRVRLGDIGILIVSPEQLRNKSLRNVLAQREIGAWVIDEAHCLSKWGNDFRPDYRYLGRFIKEKAGEACVPPVLCLTATAKPEVVSDILAHFRERVGIELQCFDGGAKRENLDFVVMQTTPATKLAHVHQLIEADLSADASGGAIVYCATRKQTEEVAAFLKEKGWAANYFHSKLQPETKKSVQESFIKGELRVIAATNAFGMGIDKPDVRLVIHADIPGSLENYLQEAGRAGRDREEARCILLYTPEDVEKQFGMSARSRLTQKEIQAILRSLRNLGKKKRKDGKSGGEIIATPGEILLEDEDVGFERDPATDDTRVRTAVSWLEESQLLTREENLVQVFPSSLRVTSLEEARKKLAARGLPNIYQNQLLAIVDALITVDADESITTDELMGIARLSPEKLRLAMADLEQLGISSNDTALTAYVHVGVERASKKRLEEVAQLEAALIAELRLNAPDLAVGEQSVLHLRIASQHLKDAGHSHAYPETLRRLLKSLAADGRDEANSTGSLGLKRIDNDSVRITLQRDWQALDKTAQLRRSAAEILLNHLIDSLPAGSRGTDLLAETTMGKLLAALNGDLLLKAEIKNPQKCLDHALLWLHEQEIICLNKGLAVFRSAMTIRLDDDWKKQFRQPDFDPLKMHYDEQILQIHVMAEYVQRGLAAMADALLLTMDYFSLQQEEFLQRWLPGREKELERQTTPASWQNIVESLGNREQRDIVADNRETTNVLVLAGPGSGKTRVLVHRLAYLVRVRRENPRGIVALAYNRHAAVQIRQRLGALIGDDARGVTVLTLHGLAMRLVGASFAERADKTDDDFMKILLDAAALLRGDGLLPEEADAQREQLLAGFRWILVDEYQDIGHEEYELISALAGRTRTDDEGKINLFAVGDDDQNIYGFKGASTEFIRRFEADYQAKPAYLIENYRSCAHIIAAANALIAPAVERMKAEHPIRINKSRTKDSPGGDWQKRDTVSQGRVQILSAGNDDKTQAMAVMAELERLAERDADWDWSTCAVIAREWKLLEPVRAYCEWRGIPVQSARENNFHFWKLRETQALLAWLKQSGKTLLDPAQMNAFLADQGDSPGWEMLREAAGDYALEVEQAELPLEHFKDWLAEWGREARRRQTDLLLVTAHGAKGLEFDHVVVLDGHWQPGKGEDHDAMRRLYYVAMTRARQTLTLGRLDGGNVLLDALPDEPCLLRRPASQIAAPPQELERQYLIPKGKEIDFGYAGRFDGNDPVHGWIAALNSGSPLTLQSVGESWYLLDAHGEKVGKMAKVFEIPYGKQCIEARVESIIAQHKDADTKYAEPKCEQWEVVVPELVFSPHI